MKVYVASSWRNEHQPSVVQMIKDLDIDLYDFRNPPNAKGFSFSEIDPNWKEWSNVQFRDSLWHPAVMEGYCRDFEGMSSSDVCVLVLPCGRSAHTEAGWFAGRKKPVVVYSPESHEPELMYLMFDHMATTLTELLSTLMYLKSRQK